MLHAKPNYKKIFFILVTLVCLTLISCKLYYFVISEVFFRDTTEYNDDIYSENGVLIDIEKILFSKNSNEKIAPASLTKIMSAFVVIEYCCH